LLKLSKLSPPSVTVGESFVYTITYENHGTAPATDLRIVESVPAATRFRAAASDSGWSCPNDSEPGTICSHALPDLPPGGAGALDFAVVLTRPPDGSEIMNVVSLTYAEGTEMTASAATTMAAPAPAAGFPALAAGLLIMLVIAARRMRSLGNRQ
jgi:uncharacterized repeat protein (TIGR01451 family)